MPYGRWAMNEMTLELDKWPSTGGNSPARCAVEACDKEVFFHGLCSFHGLQRYYREAKPDFQTAPVALVQKRPQP